MVLWLFGWFVQVKIHFKGLAEGGEVVFWCFGVFVFWLKFKSQVKGLAFGFVRLVVSSFARLVVSNRGSDDLQGFGLPMSGQSIRWVFRPVSFWKSLSPVTNGIWGSIARQLAACSASGVRSLCWARSRVASSMMVRSSSMVTSPGSWKNSSNLSKRS